MIGLCMVFRLVEGRFGRVMVGHSSGEELSLHGHFEEGPHALVFIAEVMRAQFLIYNKLSPSTEDSSLLEAECIVK